VGVFAAAAEPAALWPARQVHPAGQLGHLGALADAAVGIDGGLPGRLRNGQDRGPDPLVQVEPDREGHTPCTQVADQTVAGAGGVGTDQHRLVPRGRGELREREIGQLDQIGGGVGGGVAFPQDRGQRLGSAISAVQEGQQRVEPKPPLNVPVAPSLSEWASTRVASKSTSSSSLAGQAPAAQARVRACALAARRPASPSGSVPARSMARQAVAVEATAPNNSGWSRRTARSLRQSPPSASITARSRSTLPAWWRCRRAGCLPACHASALVSSSRSASSHSNATPAWPTTPAPSR
jgi:hypothetical protein